MSRPVHVVSDLDENQQRRLDITLYKLGVNRRAIALLIGEKITTGTQLAQTSYCDLMKIAGIDSRLIEQLERKISWRLGKGYEFHFPGLHPGVKRVVQNSASVTKTGAQGLTDHEPGSRQTSSATQLDVPQDLTELNGTQIERSTHVTSQEPIGKNEQEGFAVETEDSKPHPLVELGEEETQMMEYCSFLYRHYALDWTTYSELTGGTHDEYLEIVALNDAGETPASELPNDQVASGYLERIQTERNAS